MPNFEVGGIDVRAEPSFTGFARETKARLDEIERDIEPFNVEAEPKLIKDFKAKLSGLVEKATKGMRFDVVGAPALTKDFKAKLEELVAKASKGAKFDVEGSPALVKDFKSKLRAQVAKASDGVRFDVEFTPALSKGFKKELTGLADKAQQGVRFDVEFSPAIATGFRARLREEVAKSSDGLSMKIEARPELIDGFKRDLREKVKVATEGQTYGVKIKPELTDDFKSVLREKIKAEGSVPIAIRPNLPNKTELRAQLKAAIDAAAEGLTVRVRVHLDPAIAEFKEKLAGELKAAHLTAPVHAKTSALGSELKKGFAAAVGGVKKLASIPVTIKTIGAAALKPVLTSLSKITSLAKVATIGFGLLAAGVVAAGTVGIKQAGDFQFQQLGLQGLLQSNTKGAEVFQGLLKLAKATPFEVGDLAPTVKQLHGAGIATKDLLPDLTALADVGSILGRTGTNLSKVGIAFAKIQGKGKITGREFNSISENLPGFQAMAAIAKEMGITVPEAFEKMKTGAIPADVAIRGLVKGLKEFPGAEGFAAKAATKTLKGALTNFPDLVRINFFQAFEKSLPAITDFLGPKGKLINVLQKSLPAIAQGFVPIAGAVLDMLAALTPALGALVLSATPLITALAQSIGNLGPGLTAIGTALGAVFSPLAKVLPGLAKGFSDLVASVVGSSGGAFSALGSGIADLITGIFKSLSLLTPLIGPVLRLLGLVGSTLGRVLPVIVGALLPAAQLLAPVLATVVQLVGDLFVAFAPILEIVAKIAVQLIGALLPAFKPLTQPSFVKAVGQLAQSFGDMLLAVAPLVPILVKAAVPIATLLAKFLSIKGVLPALIAGFLAYKAAVAGIAIYQALLTGSGLAFSGPALIIAGIVAAVVLLGVGIFELYKHWKPFHDIVDATGRYIRDHLYPILILVGSVVLFPVALFAAYKQFKAFRDIVDSLGRVLKTVFQAALPVVKELFGIFFRFQIKPILLFAQAIGKLFSGDFSGFARKLGEAFTAPLGALRDLAALLGRLGIALAKFVGSAALRGLKNLGKAIVDGFSSALSNVGRFFGDLGKAIGRGLAEAAGAVGRFFTTGFVATIGHDIAAVVESIVRFFQLLPGRVVHIFTELPGQIGRAIARFGPDVIHALGFVVGAFIALPFLVVKALVRFGPVVGQALRDAARAAGRGVVTGIDAVVGFFTRLPGQAVRALVRFGPDLYNAVLSASAALGRGTRTGLIAVLGFFTRLPGQTVRAISSLGSSLGGAAGRALAAMARAVGRSMVGVVRWFSDLPGRADRAISSLGGALGRRGKAVVESFGRAAATAFKAVVRAFVRFGPDIVNGLGRGIKNGAVALGRALRTFWNGIVDGFKKVLGIASPSTVMIRLGKDIIAGLVRGIITAPIRAILGFFGGLPRKFVSAMGHVGTIFHAVGGRIIDGLKNGAARLGGIFSFFGSLPHKMVSAMGGVGSIFHDVGKRIIDGLTNGIKRFAGNAVDALKRVGGGLVDGIKGVLHFGSPSKVMFTFGEDTVQGLIDGIDSKHAQAKLTGRQMGEAIKAGFAEAQADSLSIPVPKPASRAAGPPLTNAAKSLLDIQRQQQNIKQDPGNAAGYQGAIRRAEAQLARYRKAGTGGRAFKGDLGGTFGKFSAQPDGTYRKLGADAGNQFAEGLKSSNPKIQAAFNLAASGLKKNDYSELMRSNSSIVGRGVADIAAKFGSSNEMIVASQAKTRDRLITDWVTTHGGTVREAKAMIATLNGDIAGFEAARITGARGLSGKVILAYVAMHGGTLTQAKEMIADLNARTSGHELSQAQKANRIRTNWIMNWVAIHGGTVKQAGELYKEVGTKVNDFNARTAQKNELFKEGWIAKWVRIHGGSKAEAAKMFQEIEGKAATGRALLLIQAERQRADYIKKWVALHHGSVREAVASYNDLAGHAKRGGGDIGNALTKGLIDQEAKIKFVMAAYGRDIRDPLNKVLGGLGLPEIRDGHVQVAVAGRGHILNTGGVVPGGGPNVDQVHTFLTPREYVVQRPRVDEQGVQKLHALNEGRADIVLRKPDRGYRYNRGGLVGEPQRLLAGGLVGGRSASDPTITHLDRAFLAKFLAYSAKVGPLSITSGWRSSASQAALFRQKPNLAAPPGKSNHERGLAIDHAPGSVPAMRAIARAMGLNYPMASDSSQSAKRPGGKYEPWHVEPAGLSRNTLGALGVAALVGAIAGIQVPKPPRLSGKPWLDRPAQGAMDYTYLKAQEWADSHAFNPGLNPGGGSAPGAVSQFFGAASGSLLGRVMAAIRQHESRGNYRAKNPHGAGGAYQVLPSTWRGYAGYPSAEFAPPAVQDRFAAQFMGPVLASHGNDPGAVAAYWYTGDASRANDRVVPGRSAGNTQSVVDYANYIRNLAQHIAGVPGYEYGGIIRHEDIVRVGERGKAEVIIPLTKPAEARRLSDQSGLTKMVQTKDKSVHIDRVVVEVTPPNVDSPEAYGAAIANRMLPALAAAIERSLH